MTPEVTGYGGALDAMRADVDHLAVALAKWSGRTEPDADARRAASAAVAAVDAMISGLYAVRVRLLSETRRADRAADARVDALLRQDGRPT